MGRGNVCVFGDYEGLFYIDNDHFHVYRQDCENTEEPEVRLMGDLDYGELTSGKWLYDEIGTSEELDDIIECLVDDFTRKYPSFHRVKGDKWVPKISGGRSEVRAIMESALFYIALEDNEWSMAVELIQKEDAEGYLHGFQKRHCRTFLNGIKECLLNRLPSIGTYSGAWTSGTLRKEDLK